jgi:hypothetical protein
LRPGEGVRPIENEEWHAAPDHAVGSPQGFGQLPPAFGAGQPGQNLAPVLPHRRGSVGQDGVVGQVAALLEVDAVECVQRRFSPLGRDERQQPVGVLGGSAPSEVEAEVQTNRGTDGLDPAKHRPGSAMPFTSLK